MRLSEYRRSLQPDRHATAVGYFHGSATFGQNGVLRLV